MPPKKTIPITERVIPGITPKQVFTFIGIVAAAVWVYFNLIAQIKEAQKVSRDNNSILREMQADRKETDKINNIRLTNIELDQREAKIRLTNLETQNK